MTGFCLRTATVTIRVPITTTAPYATYTRRPLAVRASAVELNRQRITATKMIAHISRTTARATGIEGSSHVGIDAVTARWQHCWVTATRILVPFTNTKMFATNSKPGLAMEYAKECDRPTVSATVRCSDGHNFFKSSYTTVL